MDTPSKRLEQIVFDTGPKIDKHMLIVMDNSTHEEHLSQALPNTNKQNKIDVSFLTA